MRFSLAPFRQFLWSTLSFFALSALVNCGGGGGGGQTAVAPPPTGPTGPVFTTVETIAGQAGVRGSADGTGDAATFNYPVGVAATGAAGATNNEVILYIAGLTENIRYQQVGYAGNPVGTAIGLGTSGTLDGGPTTALVRAPTGIGVGYNSPGYEAYVYWSEPEVVTGGSVIRKLTAYPLDGNRTAVTVAGSVTEVGTADGSGASARFNRPEGVLLNPRTGELFIADRGNYTIRRYRATASGTVDTVAGLGGSAGTTDGAGANARFYSPRSIAMDSKENLYVTDFYCIRKITPAGVVSTFAGNGGIAGYADGPAADARFDGAAGIAIDEADNIYVTEDRNHTIRKITPAGVVTTLAGIAKTPGAANGALNVATFNTPEGISYYNKQLFIADSYNQIIRRIR